MKGDKRKQKGERERRERKREKWREIMKENGAWTEGLNDVPNK